MRIFVSHVSGTYVVHHSMVQSYAVHLCLALCPPTCIMHHGAQFFEKSPPTFLIFFVILYRIHLGGVQCSFVQIRWCTCSFFMYIISNQLDGAQCDVVSLNESQSPVHSICRSIALYGKSGSSKRLWIAYEVFYLRSRKSSPLYYAGRE